MKREKSLLKKKLRRGTSTGVSTGRVQKRKKKPDWPERKDWGEDSRG